MREPVFDYDSGNFIYQSSENTGVDTEGHFHMMLGDYMSMDLDSGDIHINSGWKNNSNGFDFDDEDDEW